ncbi:MAG: DEAD/DEAH box helicase, partial [Anaerolineae bacterium]|nr:DEAD/DEAH box helicase [Anaerolineae bacterium]
MPSLVSIDIETTGLDANRDAIIEIGAVRFSDNRIDAEWSTLINPNKPIPDMITQLTGISNEMVRNAPTIKSVTHELEDFVGELPVVGHNVRFDLGFLQKQRVLMSNPVVDTYEMASVMLPSASRYNLSALCSQLNIILEGGAHRALNDARATQKVYSRLFELGAQLPTDLLAEIVRKGDKPEWGGFWAFQEMLKARIRQPPKAKSGTAVGHFKALNPKLYPPLKPREDVIPLDTDEISAILDHGGQFSKYFSSYERRPQQIEMLQAVTTALSKSNHLMVEAGTGTGKSFAYLIPAAHWALKNEQRVVISTNTINLQEQLINKDIPDLRHALELDLRA